MSTGGGTFELGNGAGPKNVPLSELAQFTYGYTDKAKDTGNARFIRITDINDDGCLNPFDAKYITLTDESKKYLLKKGDLLLARTGATYGKTLYVPDDTPAVYASFLIKITLNNSRILNRYYWHFSKSNLYWTQAEKFVSKGGQQQFNSSAVGRVVVPLPSLEVQQKIVDVLDNFDSICSDLNIGLPAEIEARKKQYEYYRDMLLTFAATDDIILTDRQTDRQNIIKLLGYVFGYVKLPVSDIIYSLKTGLNPRQNFKLNVGGTIPYITGKDIYSNSVNISERTDRITEEALQLINRRAALQPGLLLFASTGTGTVGRMAIVHEYQNDWGISETLYAIKADETIVMPEFLMYMLYSADAKNQFEPKISKGSVPHLKVADLLNVCIAVPPLKKQNEIVSVLKHFDTLCNDLTTGLPAEIKARQKQYEYYRDKLLTFKELGA